MATTIIGQAARDMVSRRLVAWDCQDGGCGPHVRCLDCGNSLCWHVQAWLSVVTDVNAAIAALPMEERP